MKPSRRWCCTVPPSTWHGMVTFTLTPGRTPQNLLWRWVWIQQNTLRTLLSDSHAHTHITFTHMRTSTIYISTLKILNYHLSYYIKWHSCTHRLTRACIHTMHTHVLGHTHTCPRKRFNNSYHIIITGNRKSVFTRSHVLCCSCSKEGPTINVSFLALSSIQFS